MYSTVAEKADLSTEWLNPARANGNIMYPAWAIEEYASSRTTCRCCRASRFPMNIVNSDSMAKMGAQKAALGRKPTNMIWRRPANPAAFDATERYAATGTGDPS